MTDGPAATLLEAVRAARRWPSGLYVHFPYCPYRCPYCDFNAHLLPGREAADGVVQAILDEAEGWARLAAQAHGSFRTLYLGGGTPSLLTPRQLARLLDGLRERLPLHGVGEATLEANPGTLTPARVEALVAQGIDRVSLGVQSLDAGELRRLGRWQSPRQARRSVALLREAGLDNLSADLIFAIPGQTLASLRRTLEEVVEVLDVAHVSAYCLTVEEGTPLHRLQQEGRLSLPGEPTQAAMYRAVVRRLEQSGLLRYEVSNFARPGFESQHNLNYWRHGTYLGLGPGAHSFWEGFRFAHLDSPGAYAREAERFRRGDPLRLALVERLPVSSLMDERVMLGLRLAEGLDRRRFREDFGCWPEEAYPGPAWERLEAAGLLVRDETFLRLAPDGWLVADGVVREIVSGGRRRERSFTAGASTPTPAR